MELILAVTWWFLAQTYDPLVAPRAMGPYPSLALCKVAGRALFPEDERFMLAAGIAKRREKALEQARKLAETTKGKSEEDQLRLHIELLLGDNGTADTLVENTGWMQALTGCMKTE